MPNELKISIVGDASSAYEALQNVNKVIGESAERADIFEKALRRAEVTSKTFDDAVRTAAVSLEKYIESERRSVEATDRQINAWQKEIATQNARIEKEQEIARAKEMSALKADILSRAAAQAEREQAAATEELAAAAAHSVTPIQASSAAIRGLMGGMNVRALERFVSGFMGLGPVLQAAFPIFGAVALFEVIGHLAESAAKFAGQAEELGRELGVGWLDGAIAQVTGLAKAVKDADAEINHLNSDIDEQHRAQRSAQAEYVSITQGQAAGYRFRQQQTQQEIASLQQSIKLAQQRYDIEAKGAEIHTNQFGSQLTNNPGGLMAALEARKHAEEDKRQIDDQTERLRTLQMEYRNLGAEAERAQEKADKKTTKKPKDRSGQNDRVDFEIEAAAARQAIKDEEEITKAIEKRKKAEGDAVIEMVRDDQFRASENQRILDQITEAAVRDEQERTAAARRAEAEREKLQEKEAAAAARELERQRQAYMKFTGEVGGQFTNVVDTWLRGGERMSKAWTDAGDQIALSMINSLMRVGAQELITLAVHQAVGDQQRLSDAKTAAANSYQWASAWGGPIAGAAAAATAFAAVAGFDVGTDYVPKTGLAVIHQGERIIDADSNRQLTRAMSGGAQGGASSFHYHDHTNLSGIDGASVAGMYQKHGAAARREFHRQMRLANKA